MVTLYAKMYERPRSSIKRDLVWLSWKLKFTTPVLHSPGALDGMGRRKCGVVADRGILSLCIYLLAALHSASSDVNILVLSSSLMEGSL